MMEQKSSLDQTSSESFFFFNPRTPCGVRQTGGEITWTRCWFQSTHSLRSATGDCASYSSVSSSFNPRTPCGVRLNIESSSDEEEEEVSIHALLAECDSEDNAGTKRTIRFNPRTPCGVRLSMLRSGDWAFIVSIHALLAECDTITGFFLKRLRSFNPRTPCGVRLKADEKESILWAVFQSTHSLRSATKEHETSSTTRKVSIHALLAECDGLPQL